MKNTPIKQKSYWPALDAALSAAADGAAIPSATFAAVADRLRSAIDAPDAARVRDASDILEQFYRQMASTASPAVQAVSRGLEGGDIAAGYVLGKIAFAQLLAARIADTRADDRFINHVRDARYLPYIQAMYAEPLSVSALRDKVGTRIETVSRKLAVLRSIGIVTSRRQGTVVVNMLTPAAKDTVDALGLVIAQEVDAIIRPREVQKTLEKARGTLSPHMQGAQPFRGRSNPRKYG